MIEAIIGIVIALIGGAFFYGRNTVKNKQTKDDLESIRKANENREQVSTIDDLPSEFDRLREKRRR